MVEPSWGQGYATETLESHAASRRVMEKAGMRLHRRRVGEVDGEQADLVVYELPARS